ncbi:ATP-binding cassette, subfamily C, bacterial CydD [Acidiphilium sp. MT5]
MATPTEPLPRSANKILERWLRSYVERARWPLGLAIGVNAGNGLLLVLQCWLLALLVNKVVIEHGGLDAVRDWLIALFAVFLVRSILAGLAERIGFEASARIKYDIRQQLYQHMTALGPAWLAGQRTGELTNNVVDGVESLDKYYTGYLPAMALAGFLPLAILVFVFPHYWVGGLIMLITAPLIPFFMVLVGKGAERINQRQWRELARMSAHFFDAIEGLTTLKLFGASRAEAAMIGRVSHQYRQETMMVLRVAFLSSLVLEFFATVSVAMVAVYIGFDLYYREMPFLSGFFVLLLAPEFYRPLRMMGTHYHARMEAIGAAERMVALLDAPVDAKKASRRGLGHARMQIDFSGVGFGYQAGLDVIEDINFTLHAGQSVALVGASGAGKTTIAKLLLGFLTPNAGRICVQDVDLRTIDLADWHERVAWLPQRATLFQGSVRDNIRLGMQADDTALLAAARAAHADEFISRLPQGFDTILGERGQGLSGGEIQRIGLARAFLKNAELLVLDEASAHLDPQTASLVNQSVEKLMRDRTVLMIAHRLEAVRHADLILVLERGRIIERGTHEQLMAARGAYAASHALDHGAA